MRRRFRRRDREDSTNDGHASLFGRVPAGVYWTIMAFIVLGLVLTYSHHEEKEGMSHSQTAKELEKKGVYQDAIVEYRKALENPRVSRKDRGEVAAKIANLYYDQFEDFGAAYDYFVRAKQLAPKLFEDKELSRRMKSARQLSSGPGTVIENEGSTQTIIQRVELQTPPMEDSHGPVVARFKGTEIHAGEIARAMRLLPDNEVASMKENSRQLEKWVQGYVDKSLLYRAAVDASYQRNPDISALLYDYQRSIIAERYERDLREKARVVPNSDVEVYYKENIAKFSLPGYVTLAQIKTADEKSAKAAQEALRKGAAFGDVATSFSLDKATTRTKGILGRATEKDGFIPGLGHKPDLVKTLMGLKVNDVTSPAAIDGNYYIFTIIDKDNGSSHTLDEVRPQIESILRTQKSTVVGGDLAKNLRADYGLEMDNAGISKIWESAAKNPALPGDGVTTAAASQPTRVEVGK